MHTEKLPLASVADTFGAAVQVLDAGGLGTVLVTDSGGRLSGIVTDGDVRRAVRRGTIDLDRPVEGVMTRNPRTADKDMKVGELLDVMEQNAITTLPVLDRDGTVAGIVHLHDLLGKGRISFSDRG